MLHQGKKSYEKTLEAAEGRDKIKDQSKVFGLRNWKLLLI